MKTQVFLIDYENVQPDVLPALALEDVLRPKNRPSTQKKLANTLTKAVFAERLDEETINVILAQLEKRELLIIEGQKVHYIGDLEGGSV